MKSQKMKKLNLMFMSLLLAGMGMAFTACSSDNDAKPEEVVLDADTLQVFDGFDVKFQMLDAQGRPVTKFKEGENITFKLAVTNKQKETFDLPSTFIGMDAFHIFSTSGNDLGLPWDAVVTKGFPVFRLHQSESAIVSYQAFGKKDEEIPFESKLDFARNKDRNPLPKGSYYTQFELNLNAQGKTPSEGSKGIVCKKSFTIE
jgi:hypothetical protein